MCVCVCVCVLTHAQERGELLACVRGGRKKKWEDVCVGWGKKSEDVCVREKMIDFFY